SLATFSRYRPRSGPIIRPIRTSPLPSSSLEFPGAPPPARTRRGNAILPIRESALHTRSASSILDGPAQGGTMSRVAVVTGAASGMGLAIAERLARERHRLALLDVDGDAAERAAGELRESGTAALAAKVDVTDRGAVDEALDRVRTDLGPIEIM